MTGTGSHCSARKAHWAGFLAILVLLEGCAEAPSDPNIRDTMPRVVSLNPCTDAILLKIAQPSQVLALSHYSHDPRSTSVPLAEAKQFASVSGTMEEIAALDPDLVFASSFMAPATSAALDDLGFAYGTFGIANSVEQSFEQIRYAAERLGSPKAGEDLIFQIETALRRHKAPPGAKPISTVLWQPGEIVPGEGTLIFDLMSRAGFSSHSAALGMGQADHLSLEVLVANPPDLLLIAGDSRGQQHPALAALKDTRVELLDPSLLYCGGPTIVPAMERLGEIGRSMRGEK